MSSRGYDTGDQGDPRNTGYLDNLERHFFKVLIPVGKQKVRLASRGPIVADNTLI